MSGKDTLGPFRELLVSGKKNMHEILKMDDFRSRFVHFIESYLLISGLNKKIVVFGRDISVELKMSKKSLITFAICDVWSLIMYELPYLALPTKGLPVFVADKKTEIKVQKMCSVATMDSFQPYGDLVASSIQDALALYVADFEKKDKTMAIERHILSRLYEKKIAAHEQFNWHMFVSEVHPSNEKHLHSIHTNHKSIVDKLAQNGKDKGTSETPVIELPKEASDMALNFYAKYEATFTIPNQSYSRRLEVIILNQWADRSTVA